MLINYQQILLPVFQQRKPYPSPGRGERVVLIDYGMKHGILRELNKRDCDVIVVPYNTPADVILFFIPRWHCLIEWAWKSRRRSKVQSIQLKNC